VSFGRHHIDLILLVVLVLHGALTIENLHSLQGMNRPTQNLWIDSEIAVVVVGMNALRSSITYI